MEVKTCSRCNETKDIDKFIKRRNICKICSGIWAKKSREKRFEKSLLKCESKVCKVCNIEKPLSELIKDRYLCKDCNNKTYRDLYKNNSDYRDKILLKDKNKNKAVAHAAQNRRYHTNPICRFISVQRSRIAIALKCKQKHTIEYLGCNSDQYYNWLKYNFNNSINFDNYGTEWHIDHVIPIYNFNMEDENEQLLAFNWRNTMPLSICDNLKKGKNICKIQITAHIHQLINYHTEYHIKLPEIYINLFAKHLDAGSPLEPIQSNKLENHYQVCKGNKQMAEMELGYGNNVEDWVIRSVTS